MKDPGVERAVFAVGKPASANVGDLAAECGAAQRLLQGGGAYALDDAVGAPAVGGIEDEMVPIGVGAVVDNGVGAQGAQLLGFASRANPTVRDEGAADPDWRLHACLESLHKLGIDALVTIGGDDTAFSASPLAGARGHCASKNSAPSPCVPSPSVANRPGFDGRLVDIQEWSAGESATASARPGDEGDDAGDDDAGKGFVDLGVERRFTKAAAMAEPQRR